MKKTTATIAAATAALAMATLSACTTPAPPAEDGELTTIRIATLNVAATMVLPVMIEQGFLEDHGIEAEVTLGELSTFIPALGSQYDIVMTTPTDFLTSATAGFDIITSAGGWADGAGVYSKVASTIEELAGKKIATNSLAGLQYSMLVDSLEQNGIDGYELIQVPFASQPDQLIAEQVDAATVPEPFASALEAEGFTRIFTPIEEATGQAEALTGWFSTSRAFADANPEVLAEWEAAFAEAVDWIEANPEEFRAFVEEQLELDPAVAAAITLPTFTEKVTPDLLSIYLGPLVRQGILDEAVNELDLSEFVL